MKLVRTIAAAAALALTSGLAAAQDKPAELKIDLVGSRTDAVAP